MRHVSNCELTYLYERQNPSTKLHFESWQLNMDLIPDLPEVNDEEKKYFQKLE
jgi:hypothetical protein